MLRKSWGVEEQQSCLLSTNGSLLHILLEKRSISNLRKCHMLLWEPLKTTIRTKHDWMGSVSSTSVCLESTSKCLSFTAGLSHLERKPAEPCALCDTHWILSCYFVCHHQEYLVSYHRTRSWTVEWNFPEDWIFFLGQTMKLYWREFFVGSCVYHAHIGIILIKLKPSL